MSILFSIILFLAGIVIGCGIVYMFEKRQITELIARCEYINMRLSQILDQEEKFMEIMWPKEHNDIPMNAGVANYLKGKYFKQDVDRDWSDCEDESDNMYI